MKFGVFAIVFLLWAGSVLAQESKSVDPCIAYGQEVNQQVSEWDYAQFEENGWRVLASKKCFFAAGSSIVIWLSTHEKEATPAQTRTLRYHAARVFAMSGRSQIAQIHLKQAKNPDQEAGAVPDWNSYIDAFSAWLSRDISALRTSIGQLALQAEDENGFKPNLIAAKRFLVCYSRPYASIETDPVCLEEKKDATTTTNDAIKENSAQ